MLFVKSFLKDDISKAQRGKKKKKEQKMIRILCKRRKSIGKGCVQK